MKSFLLCLMLLLGIALLLTTQETEARRRRRRRRRQTGCFFDEELQEVVCPTTSPTPQPEGELVCRRIRRRGRRRRVCSYVTNSPTMDGGSSTASPTSAATDPQTNSPTSGATDPQTNSPTSAATDPQTNSPTPAANTDSPTTSITPATSQYDIILEFKSSVTASQRQAFENAVAKWRSIIVGDVPYTLTYPQQACGHNFGSQTVVDDLLIIVDLSPIDGTGGILGQAGPCSILYGTTRMGIMSFDQADVVNMENSGIFEGVILHEMGHVLGLGTLWSMWDLIQDEENPSNPAAYHQYFGQYGNQGYQAIGRSGNALIEDQGGQGTARSHWDEQDLDTELMTGYVDFNMKLSSLTVGSLKDMGYTVNDAAAEAFTAPNSGRRLRSDSEERVTFGDDVLVLPEQEPLEIHCKPGREADCEKQKVNFENRRRRRA